MIVDVYNEIFTELKVNQGLNVVTDFPEQKAVLPCVVFKEFENINDLDTRDSAGDHYNLLHFELQIFTEGNSKRSDAVAIRQTVDDVMSTMYNMHRDFSNEVPNYLDRSIYRYVMRYGCKVNEDKTIYRR